MASTETLVPLDRRAPSFPPTRYQGSKRKLALAIVEKLRPLDFTTVLDAFGGTGAVAYALKCEGKRVTYNDYLRFNHQIGLALIENDRERLTHEEIEGMDQRAGGVAYGDFIERTFEGIYFTTEENRWLDTAVANTRGLPTQYKRALAWYALFQAAMAKRPYNLFHRKNLYMRTADVPRGFGNKRTWDRSFTDHFRSVAARANTAVLDGGGTCRAMCRDVMEVEPEYELVYIDPPYLNARGIGVDYHRFYHFLEGMMDYDHWGERLDRRFSHRPLLASPQPWNDPRRSLDAFRTLFDRFRRSILAVSYRSDGIPGIDDLARALGDLCGRVRVLEGRPYQYALSTARATREVLLIAIPT